MKYLFLIALFFFVLWIFRKAKASRSGMRPPTPRAPERMVKCSYCGVNQPVSESILVHGRFYCCVAHQHEVESVDD